MAGDRGLVSPAGLLRAAGMKPVIDYIHSRGLRFGICKPPCRLFPVPGGQQPRPLSGMVDCHAAPVDTDRGSKNCKGVDTGSDSHWVTDANDFAA